MSVFSKTLGRYFFLLASVSTFGTVVQANAAEMHTPEMSAEAPIAAPVAEVPIAAPVAEVPKFVPMAEAPVNVPVAAPVAEVPKFVPMAEAPVNVPVAAAPVNVPVAAAPVNVPVAAAPVNVPVALAPVAVPATNPVAMLTQAPVVSVPTPVVAATPVLTSHTFSMPSFSLANALLNSYANPQLVGVSNFNHHYWNGNTPRADGGGMTELRQHMMPATSLTVPTGFAVVRALVFLGEQLALIDHR